jgi:hypothetical protein
VPFQAKDYARLEREIASESSTELLNQLKVDHPVLQPYGSWLEVVAETQHKARCDSDRDALLRPLLSTYRATRDCRIPSILMVMFWRRLRSLCRRKGAWDPDEDVRWANTLVAFHWSVFKYPIDDRPDRIESKILGDTLHRLYEDYERDLRFLDRNLLYDPRPKPDVAPQADRDKRRPRERGEWDLGVAVFETADGLKPEVEAYRRDLKAGVINETEFYVLLATRVYGQPLVDYAAEHSLDYQNLKRQRLRAEARRRRARKK